MKTLSAVSLNCRSLGRRLAEARLRSQRTQKSLAQACGLAQSDISKFESGERWPTLPQLVQLASELRAPLQWFLTGQEQPGFDLADTAIQLQRLGLVDLFVPQSRAPGAFLPPEQVLARMVCDEAPDPRLVEAAPALLAWNSLNPLLLKAFCLSTGNRRTTSRLAWLADVALTIHRGQGFPGGLVDPRALSKFVAHTKRPARPDDLGHPAGKDAKLPPVSRRWNICYAADLNTFLQRARRLHELRTQESGAENRP